MLRRIYLTHLPLLRIEQEVLTFAGCTFWRLPFDIYNRLTAGAFPSFRSQFEKTAPVFVKFVDERDRPLETDGRQLIQTKIRTFGRDKRTPLEERLELLWAALLLAAPVTALPSPMYSITLGLAAVDEQDNYVVEWTMQGDTDHEYLFLYDAAAPSVGEETIGRAMALIPLVEWASNEPSLASAILMLKAVTNPTLSMTEQTTLSTIALESLLLPEARSGLASTFKRRLSNLLGKDDDHRRSLRKIAGTLYDARSASVHGGGVKWKGDHAVAVRDAYAQQLLAASIVALSSASSIGDKSLEAMRSELDENAEYSRFTDIPELPVESPLELRREERMEPEHPELSAVVSSRVDMAAVEGTVISWSPLIGMGIASKGFSPEHGSYAVLPLSGPELLTMEHKDIRRDFANRLFTVGNNASVIYTQMEEDASMSTVERGRWFARRRNLAVTSMRLAGLGEFVDPEYLGWFIFEGRIKRRRGSIFRQTIEDRMLLPPDRILEETDHKSITRTWGLLSRYHTDGQDPEVDHVLNMFRRTYDDLFQPRYARGSLMIATLEAILGRSRRSESKGGLEDLVRVVIGADSPSAMWYSENGRRFRNEIAHGRLDLKESAEGFTHMTTVLEALVADFIQVWNQRPKGTFIRPGRLYIDNISERVR